MTQNLCHLNRIVNSVFSWNLPPSTNLFTNWQRQRRSKISIPDPICKPWWNITVGIQIFQYWVRCGMHLMRVQKCAVRKTRQVLGCFRIYIDGGACPFFKKVRLLSNEPASRIKLNEWNMKSSKCKKRGFKIVSSASRTCLDKLS